MKSFLCSIILVLVFTSLSGAQIRFGLGLRTGLNFGTVSLDPEPTLPQGVTKSGLTSFAVGAAAELEFARMFAAVVEPRYIMKGTKFEQGSAKQTISTSELEFPIHFKVKFIQGPVRPFAFAGPNIGIVMSAKVKLEGTGNDSETDIKSTTSSTNFGIDFGGGAEFAVAPKVAITGDVRYSLGLSNMDSTPGGTGSSKTRGFQILAGVLFLL